ncbi:MAG: T9SS type B sorting domain-containing protein, partial [Flavobacterium sp.]|nr:T9SS type B sorting domain-containing protein [Flavobacterium sp.]
AATGAITPSTSTPGTYTVTYTIPASGGCAAVPVMTSVTITALPTASISYAGTPFCTNVTAAQAVTLTGTGVYTGGSYASTVGLSINATTGAITPSTSIPGTYTVTYSTLASGGCGVVTATTSVTITALPAASISYGTPFCTSITTAQNVTLTGTGAYTGGSFASTASLSINASTGAITPSTSTPGTYTVTYSTLASGGCGVVTATTNVTITALPTAVINYSPSYCTSTTSAQAVALTGSGAYTGGSYSSTAGLSINATTGAITPSASTPGTHTVTYSTLASGGCGVVTTTASIEIVRAPIAGTAITPSRQVCDYDVTSIDLFGLISGEDAGGIWSRISGTGGTFNATAGTFASAVGATDSMFEYRVAGTGPCSDATVRVTIIINTPPVVVLEDNQIVCLDVHNNPIETILLTTGLRASFTYVWEKNGVVLAGEGSPSLVVDAPGTYKVTVTNTSGCTESDSTIVGSSIAPTKPELTSSAYFSDHSQITVLSPIGPDYEYSLDGGAFQDETVFMNVSGGKHTVVVQNKKGCGRDENEIRIVNYPHYFTPNGDGYHETWNIFDISNQTDARIHIFDRFGKLIKEIRPSGNGWDGTFNGQPLPSTDYWFVVYYLENQAYKEFRAHFALKR